MKTKGIAVLLLLLLVGIYGFLALFSSDFRKKKPLIVCTTSIIADAVSDIVGNQIAVKTLMGPGVDPHLYRPRESDVVALSNADLIFYNGLHLEGKMVDLFQHMARRVPTCAVTTSISKKDFIETEFQTIYDPHVWHDVSLWMHVIPVILEGVIPLKPESKSFFQDNALRYTEELRSLHTYVQEKAGELSANKRILLTAHDAFSYFGRAYGFQVIGLQGISTDAVITAEDIQNMVDTVKRYQIPAIFLESSIPAKSIEAVEKAVASHGKNVFIAPELFSDSLGDKTTTAKTYCGMIKHNIDVIVSSLNRKN